MEIPLVRSYWQMKIDPGRVICCQVKYLIFLKQFSIVLVTKQVGKFLHIWEFISTPAGSKVLWHQYPEWNWLKYFKFENYCKNNTNEDETTPVVIYKKCTRNFRRWQNHIHNYVICPLLNQKLNFLRNVHQTCMQTFEKCK